MCCQVPFLVTGLKPLRVSHIKVNSKITETIKAHNQNVIHMILNSAVKKKRDKL